MTMSSLWIGATGFAGLACAAAAVSAAVMGCEDVTGSGLSPGSSAVVAEVEFGAAVSISGESSSWICGACHGAVGISRRRLSSNEADAGWVRITLFVPAAG
jgi:cytochrome c553